jgi:hypothetical protein
MMSSLRNTAIQKQTAAEEKALVKRSEATPIEYAKYVSPLINSRWLVYEKDEKNYLQDIENLSEEKLIPRRIYRICNLTNGRVLSFEEKAATVCEVNATGELQTLHSFSYRDLSCVTKNDSYTINDLAISVSPDGSRVSLYSEYQFDFLDTQRGVIIRQTNLLEAAKEMCAQQKDHCQRHVSVDPVVFFSNDCFGLIIGFGLLAIYTISATVELTGQLRVGANVYQPKDLFLRMNLSPDGNYLYALDGEKLSIYDFSFDTLSTNKLYEIECKYGHRLIDGDRPVWLSGNRLLFINESTNGIDLITDIRRGTMQHILHDDFAWHTQFQLFKFPDDQFMQINLDKQIAKFVCSRFTIEKQPEVKFADRSSLFPKLKTCIQLQTAVNALSVEDRKLDQQLKGQMFDFFWRGSSKLECLRVQQTMLASLSRQLQTKTSTEPYKKCVENALDEFKLKEKDCQSGVRAALQAIKNLDRAPVATPQVMLRL